MRRARRLCAGSGSRQRLARIFQPVDLPEPQGGGRGRIPGAGAVTIPSPQITLQADQPLTRHELRLEARPIRGIDQADLTHAAGQYIGNRYVVRKGLRTARQRLGPFIQRQFPPARRAILLCMRRMQIIRQRCAQSRLIALLHLKAVHDMVPLAGIPL